MFKNEKQNIELQFLKQLAERLHDVCEVLLDLDERISKLEGKDKKC